MKIQKFDIEGMTCAACVSHVEKSVNKLSGIKSVQVNLLTNSMNVEFDEVNVNDTDISNAVSNAGYKATPHEVTALKTKKTNVHGNNEVNELKTRWWLSLAFLIPILYFSMGQMLGIPVPVIFKTNFLVLSFTQFLLVIPVAVVNYKYFSRGFGQLFKAPNMDSLVATGSTAAISYGIYSIFKASVLSGNGHSLHMHQLMDDLYFESGATILTLVTLGKYLEAVSKSKTTSAISTLLSLTPENALVIRNNKEYKIPVNEIVKGDRTVIKSGDRIPVDGIIISGYGNIDTSAITGESMPQFKESGDTVNSATINNDGYFTFEATRVGEDTTLSQIVRLVEEAAASKAPVGRLADKISGIFVPVVIGLAIIAAAAWLMAGYSFSFSLSIAISVLVISCPCALGLATPLAIMVGAGKGAQNGILIKSASVFESAAAVDTVILDKTGTITTGKPQVTEIVTFDINNADFLLTIAASLEKASEHPIAYAIIEEAKNRKISVYQVENPVVFPGKGISGKIEDNTYFIGNDKLLSQHGIYNSEIKEVTDRLANEGKTPLFIFNNKGISGIIAVADSLKNDSKAAIQAMDNEGLAIVMLTGDNELTAKYIQQQTGIETAFSGLLPDEKEKIVDNLRLQGKKTAMVGDGINDAPSLVRADVGIAIGAGTQVAIEAADIVLMNSNLYDVVNAIRLSKKVLKNIKENLFWAFFYNIICIPVAAGVFYAGFGIKLDPMFAAAAMSLSSVTVVMNALRLIFFKTVKSEINNNNLKTVQIMKQKTILIEGMSCGHCSMRVEKALNAVEGVSAKVDLAEKKATVTINDSVTDDQLKKSVEDAGYNVIEIKN